jgi:hypothetical protein
MAPRSASAFVLAALCASCAARRLPPSEEYLQTVFSSQASWRFSEFFFCPLDRIRITQREGPLPPSEIAVDPGRVAVWKQLRVEGVRYYDLSGCGHHETVECKLGWRNSCRPESVDGPPEQDVPNPVMSPN